MIKFFNSILKRFGYKLEKFEQAYTPSKIRFELKRNGLNQKFVAEYFEVTQAAVCRAIEGDAALSSLREKIITLAQRVNDEFKSGIDIRYILTLEKLKHQVLNINPTFLKAS